MGWACMVFFSSGNQSIETAGRGAGPDSQARAALEEANSRSGEEFTGSHDRFTGHGAAREPAGE